MFMQEAGERPNSPPETANCPDGIAVDMRAGAPRCQLSHFRNSDMLGPNLGARNAGGPQYLVTERLGDDPATERAGPPKLSREKFTPGKLGCLRRS